VSCEYADRDGAYVLGALAPAERLEFEEHLAGCAACARSVRELAGLPGLLSRVDRAVVEEPFGEEPVPDTVLPALLGAVHRTRRRRTLVTTGAVAATVAVAVLGLALSRSGDGAESPVAEGPASSALPSPSAGRAMVPVGDAPVRARLALASVAWGTRLDLSCTYEPESHRYELPQTASYALFVVTREGRTEQVGTWRSAEGRTMHVTAATSAPRRDIASVEVRTSDGHPVLELTS
jgi:anti-sigma factor RsiW